MDGLADGDALVASSAFDRLGPLAPAVAVALDEDPTGGTLPDELKDWLALKALSIYDGEDEPATAEGVLDVRIAYAIPNATPNGKRMRELVGPYLVRRGSRV